MSEREKRRFKITELPRDLHEALETLEKDKVIGDALGAHILERLIEAKREEWREYSAQVHRWEVDRYLGRY
jgi:glutamine synthetase